MNGLWIIYIYVCVCVLRMHIGRGIWLLYISLDDHCE